MKKSVILGMMLAAGLTVGSRNASAITPAYGIDVSSDNGGGINWTSVHNAGKFFAFARCTIGSYYLFDADFDSNTTSGKAAGLKMGAYHVTHSGVNTPQEEVDYFWHHASGYVKADGKSIYPFADFEVFDGHEGYSNYTGWLNAWASDLITAAHKSSVTMIPKIYVSACNAGLLVGQYYSGGITMDPDIASYNSVGPWYSCDCDNAWVTGCGTGNWVYWQYSDSGNVGGIDPVDLDEYDGTTAALDSFEIVKTY